VALGPVVRLYGLLWLPVGTYGYRVCMNSEPEVARDPEGGVVVTLEHADGSQTIVSADSTRTSFVLRFIARRAEQA
jgi:hypothetical protein